MMVEPFKIESESEADSYLRDLLEKSKYRTIDEIEIRAQQYIEDNKIKNYFVKKARGMLKTYGHEIE